MSAAIAFFDALTQGIPDAIPDPYIQDSLDNYIEVIKFTDASGKYDVYVELRYDTLTGIKSGEMNPAVEIYPYTVRGNHGGPSIKIHFPAGYVYPNDPVYNPTGASISDWILALIVKSDLEVGHDPAKT